MVATEGLNVRFLSLHFRKKHPFLVNEVNRMSLVEALNIRVHESVLEKEWILFTFNYTRAFKESRLPIKLLRKAVYNEFRNVSLSVLLPTYKITHWFLYLYTVILFVPHHSVRSIFPMILRCVSTKEISRWQKF